MEHHLPEFVMAAQTVIEQQLEELKSDMREMRGAITEMAKAMSKLAVLEERNLITNQAIEKLIVKVDAVEDQVTAVKLDQARFVSNIEGVSKTMKFMWGAFGGGVLYVGGQLIAMVAKHA